ncbi:hypothetical protein ACEN4P_04565 [Marinilactibacillus psychrotolerans]|uniref:Uncharacterized protein n=1 Tax=Marinilactibacillus psychrotolerans TaxID=191770 RepID=A0A5R9C877_9LACT|nr:hypothetical protein [Marinilactibacillus psychrotolerans]TLQ09603.1 hypothetical protein FEZ48_00190 [Marinilactibacillus psychrotolerans]
MYDDYPSRRKIILDGMIKKRTKNQMTVEDRVFLISEDLTKRLRARTILIVGITLLLSLTYNFFMERYDILISELEPSSGIFSEALSYTIVFIIVLGIGFATISLLAIPKNVHDHIIKELY